MQLRIFVLDVLVVLVRPYRDATLLEIAGFMAANTAVLLTTNTLKIAK